MANIYGNNAYKKLQEYQPEINKEYTQNVKLEPKISQKAKVRLMVFCNVLLVMSMASCLFGLIYSYTNLTVLTKEISTLSSELNVLQSQEISLNAQIDQMFNLEYVEDYAINNLGMIKLDQNQIEQVHIQNIDFIETYETTSVKDVILSQVKNIFASMWEYIS